MISSHTWFRRNRARLQRCDPSIKVASLGYHEITDNPSDSGFQRPLALPYKHTRAEFREHLMAIAASGLIPGRVTDVDLDAPGTHLLLTFDDGGKSALYASEELCKQGWRAHFLITTSLIGSRTFLDKRDIAWLRQCGHTIGSHSHTHPDIFNSLTPQAMEWQWRVSCDIVSQLIGEPCVVASVPGGDISSLVLESAEASQIRFLFTSEPWLNPRKLGDCWVLGRASVKTTTSIRQVRALAAFRGWQRALVTRRVSVVARNLLRPVYNLYVRRGTESFGHKPHG